MLKSVPPPGPPGPKVVTQEDMEKFQAWLNKNWRDLTDVACGNCGGLRFDQAIRVKKLEMLRPDNPLGQDHWHRVSVMLCRDCGQELYYVDADPYKNSKEIPTKGQLLV